ncbi:hypothetical protein AS031_18350 [Pseudarthrobacter enclensis]|uniref:Uncharacterized protein n=1 Tax=Pseudarthrobacter enclensis TaxID=993070 RepID=A0A0V8I663_9MICC|nr:hypothetical protein AS031_18350 [Pseudarthrobacter enclensis]
MCPRAAETACGSLEQGNDAVLGPDDDINDDSLLVRIRHCCDGFKLITGMCRGDKGDAGVGCGNSLGNRVRCASEGLVGKCEHKSALGDSDAVRHMFGDDKLCHRRTLCRLCNDDSQPRSGMIGCEHPLHVLVDVTLMTGSVYLH